MIPTFLWFFLYASVVRKYNGLHIIFLLFYLTKYLLYQCMGYICQYLVYSPTFKHQSLYPVNIKHSFLYLICVYLVSILSISCQYQASIFTSNLSKYCWFFHFFSISNPIAIWYLSPTNYSIIIQYYDDKSQSVRFHYDTLIRKSLIRVTNSFRTWKACDRIPRNHSNSLWYRRL